MVHIIPVSNQDTRIECIYPPPNISENGYIENELLKIYKLFTNNKNGEAKELIRTIERRLKINKIKNEY